MEHSSVRPERFFRYPLPTWEGRLTASLTATKVTRARTLQYHLKQSLMGTARASFRTILKKVNTTNKTPQGHLFTFKSCAAHPS
ncbi:hypothetical protein HPB52_013786 [Rhipicephalus sanguineus]|uniref:Uncharacterized protein n=1 Tax=Rhipicephalus sanguineus TaxID=34632 RepID=A0A9D4TAA8_RHISA|nr:hypothetical protein HPB52_013786 [Rhipicephalus sanguineus]